MNHTPTSTDNLYTCPACGWRGVATGAGIITTEEGDGRALHLAAIEHARVLVMVEAVRIMDRLRMHYDNATPLPSAAHDGALTLMQLRRLFRCVTSEFEA